VKAEKPERYDVWTHDGQAPYTVANSTSLKAAEAFAKQKHTQDTKRHYFVRPTERRDAKFVIPQQSPTQVVIEHQECTREPPDRLLWFLRLAVCAIAVLDLCALYWIISGW
jgi:hypothetical protein